jgi:hypothetical protein
MKPRTCWSTEENYPERVSQKLAGQDSELDMA